MNTRGQRARGMQEEEGKRKGAGGRQEWRRKEGDRKGTGMGQEVDRNETGS